MLSDNLFYENVTLQYPSCCRVCPFACTKSPSLRPHLCLISVLLFLHESFVTKLCVCFKPFLCLQALKFTDWMALLFSVSAGQRANENVGNGWMRSRVQASACECRCSNCNYSICYSHKHCVQFSVLTNLQSLQSKRLVEQATIALQSSCRPSWRSLVGGPLGQRTCLFWAPHRQLRCSLKCLQMPFSVNQSAEESGSLFLAGQIQAAPSGLLGSCWSVSIVY